MKINKEIDTDKLIEKMPKEMQEWCHLIEKEIEDLYEYIDHEDGELQYNLTGTMSDCGLKTLKNN